MSHQGQLFDLPEPELPKDQQIKELRELVAQYRVMMNKLTGQLMYLERLFRRASDGSATLVSGFMDKFLQDCAAVPESIPTWNEEEWYSSEEVYAGTIEMYRAGRDLRRVAKKIVTVRRHFYRDIQILKQRHSDGESAFDREANLRLQQRRQFTHKEREKIWIQSERKCRYCKCKLESPDGDVMHVDHIVPVVVGGNDDIENLTAACVLCNLKKNAKSEEEFLASLLSGIESSGQTLFPSADGFTAESRDDTD
ncbi:HNH endonuclease [Schlesneria sp. T3-172]|uniref:HNH endonuclease n=1 Tax=Schlesneria sphaerica TaxID=3373610 RepID=UPI0037C6B78B